MYVYTNTFTEIELSCAWLSSSIAEMGDGRIRNPTRGGDTRRLARRMPYSSPWPPTISYGRGCSTPNIYIYTLLGPAFQWARDSEKK